MERFEVAVVGAGMIGAAAARHLAEGGRRVVVIGPGEPPDWPSADGPFASHYDSGRITRISALEPFWAELAARSIDRYADVELRSGIDFHRPVGLAWIVDSAVEDIEAVVANSLARGGTATTLDRQELERRTGIRPANRDGVVCAHEGPPAGAIDPRRMVAAQLKLAVDAGAAHLSEPVAGLRPVDGAVELSGRFGTAEANQVLLATGAYGGGPVGLDLGLIGRLRTTVRADIGAGEGLPSLIAHAVDHPELNDYVYWVPPVRFPDGRILVKIGGDHVVERSVASESVAGRNDIDSWFQTGGSRPEADALLGALRMLLPAAAVESWDAVPCVVTASASGLPLVGRVDDRLAVALGGNGAAAKSSDEIGRLAASLFEPDADQPADHPVDPVLDGSLLAPPV